MNKTIIISMAVAVLALCSCAKLENEVPVAAPTHDAVQTLTACIDNTDSKTQYEESGNKAIMSWETLDEIKLLVYAASDPDKAANFYRFRAQSSGGTAEFAPVGNAGQSITPDFTTYPRAGFAVYPSDLTVGGKLGAYTITLPGSYTVSGTDLSRIKVPLLGSTTPADGSHYTFKTAVGVLKVTLNNVPSNARKLVLTGQESDQLSGVFPMDLENGLQMSACSGSAGNVITVNFDSPSHGSTLVVYIPVPVGTLSTGATFDVQDNAGTSIKKVTTKKDLGIVRNHMLPLPAFSVDPMMDVFTDYSLSALKPGVNQAKVDELPGVYKTVAQWLLDDAYTATEKEFRIHSYAPYSDIRVYPPVFLSRLYSAMDNPTGIYVSEGDDITVCLDDVPDGQSVSLAVYGDAGDEPNFGGTADWTYGYTGSWQEGYNQNAVLQRGVNEIHITADGMLYVLNTVTQADPYNPDTTPIGSFSPVKVHILKDCGSIQGYFEPAVQTDARGDELLQACTYKYFMVKGAKCSFLFHTTNLKAYTAEAIRSGIEVMDKAVGWEKDLCGMSGADWINNHIVIGSSTSGGAYMDASHRRVLISTDNISKVVSKQGILDNEGGWGPFHEMGHLHQHPINWKSTSESSNNLFSNYCKKMLADDENVTFISRGSRIYDLAQSYAAGKPWVLLGNANYQSEDTELHMRMNWQLWNYYHNCGHNTHFFPDLFNYLRQQEHMLDSEYSSWYYWHRSFTEDPGRAQLQYYEACCAVAGEDLTEFFDAWGFFRPVNNLAYYQYGDIVYNVTQEMIDASKARVAAKGYPKAAPIQYLEDRTTVGSTTYSEMGYWEAFKGAAAVVSSPVAVVMGTAIDTYCEKAVAVELRAGDASNGTLLYFSNVRYFELPSGLSLAGNSLWAVQADGVRVPMDIIEL